MGNAALKEYSLSEAASCSGGVALAWRIYDAHKKHNEDDKVSAFVFERSQTRTEATTELVELLRHEATLLARLRHPAVLRVLQPLQETRGALVVVCERVLCSLANLLGRFGSLDPVAPYPKPSGVELKNGLRQIAEGLLFLHRDAKMYHLGVEPENIYLTPSGDWKLAGFSFSLRVERCGAVVPSGLGDFALHRYTNALPSLDYAAPELVEGDDVDHRADVFSFAKLARNLHRFVAAPSRNSVEDGIACISDYRGSLRVLLTRVDDATPEPLLQCLRVLLNPSASSRPPISAFLSSEYFSDIQSRTVRYLDKILEKDVGSRLHFLKRLPQVLPMFDEATLLRNILPPLLLQMKDAKLAAFVLPSLMAAAERLRDNPALAETLLPAILTMFARRDQPQIAFVLLKHMEFLIDVVSADVRRDTLLPLLTWSLQSRHAQLKTRTLLSLSTLLKSNHFQSRDVRGRILPRVLDLCSEAGPIAVRVNALTCLKEIFDAFDNETINGPILDALKTARALDGSNQLNVAALGYVLLLLLLLLLQIPFVLLTNGVDSVYEAIATRSPIAFTLSRIMPALFEIALSDTLTLVEFERVDHVIRAQVDRLSATRLQHQQQQKKPYENITKEAASDASIFQDDHNIFSPSTTASSPPPPPLDSMFAPASSALPAPKQPHTTTSLGDPFSALPSLTSADVYGLGATHQQRSVPDRAPTAATATNMEAATEDTISWGFDADASASLSAHSGGEQRQTNTDPFASLLH